MFRQAALSLSLFILFHAFISLAFAQTAPTAKGSVSASGCRELSSDGRINGDEEYSRELGDNLWVRFAPMKDKWGWIVSIGPADSTEDYAWPVNPPLRGDNSQYLGSSYGDDVAYRLKYEHRIFFLFDRATYDQTVKLVNDEAFSKDPDGASRYFTALRTIAAGVLYLKPIRFEVMNEGKSVNWMEYSVRVIVPASFQPAAGLSQREQSCPPMHWDP
jgi:hypothetical protein